MISSVMILGSSWPGKSTYKNIKEIILIDCSNTHDRRKSVQVNFDEIAW
jgi:hypothetical protein